MNTIGKLYEDICQSLELREKIITAINEVGVNEKLRAFEIPRIVLIEPQKWTPENGFMTSSTK